VPERAAAEGPAPWIVGAWALVLFLVWSNSFVAIGYLLGGEGAPARFDALSLTVARFLPVLLVVLPWCLLVWRQETVRTVRRHWRRLLVCGLLAVPGYNLALYTGQERGIPPPVASLETAIAPLFLMLLGTVFLGEKPSWRKVGGFVVALAGLVVIATAKQATTTPYPTLIAITALAPLAWSVYSVLTKPVSRTCHPVLWAYLALIFGTLPLLALAPFTGGPELQALDGPGAAALLFLALFCTVFGNAAWGWLVKHLSASSVGFTIFLNPPLTTASKALLAAALPATFAFRVLPREWLGGAIVLAGMAVALLGGRRPLAPTAPAPPAVDGRPRTRDGRPTGSGASP
jgi:drug/metabolite transporter (DMT)-like permease